MSKTLYYSSDVCEDSLSWEWTLKNFSTLHLVEGDVFEGPQFVSSFLPGTLWNVHFFPKPCTSECFGNYQPVRIEIFPDKIESTKQLLNLKCDCSLMIGSNVFRESTSEKRVNSISKIFLYFSDYKTLKVECMTSNDLKFKCEVSFRKYINAKQLSICKPSEELNVLSKNLKDLYASKQHSDFTIVVKEETFYVHKLILCVRSPVFDSMIRNNTKERKNNSLVIEDVEVITMRYFIAFLYTGLLEEVSPDTYLQLYTLADKYAVGSLKTTCSAYLLNNLDPNNVCEVYVAGYFHEDEYLKLEVKKFILRNASEVIKSENFNRLKNENAELAWQIVDIAINAA